MLLSCSGSDWPGAATQRYWVNACFAAFSCPWGLMRHPRTLKDHVHMGISMPPN
jgi:hypothetical protein